jgi:hypothetical protein
MKLYKYVSPERIDILINSKIRFSQAKVWNDPFELQPYYQDHIETNPLDQLFKFTKIVNEYNTNSTVPTIEQINNYENERKRITKDDIYKYLNKKITSLSLSEDKENLLMWSHYSKDHSGFVIELNTNTKFFSTNDRYLHKIEYGKDRPQVQTEEFATLITELVNLLSENEAIPETLRKKLSKGFKKGLDWDYEKEWRLISLTKNATNFKSFEKNLNTLYIGPDYFEKLYIALFPLPLETISAVYIGERAPSHLKRKLDLLTKYNPLYSHIKLINTKIDEKEFKLNYEDVQYGANLTLGELSVDINKTTKWQRFTSLCLNSFYKEIIDIKKIKPSKST